MNGTPRLRAGAFPATPQTTNNLRRRTATPQRSSLAADSPKLPDIGVLHPSDSAESTPLVSFDTLDAPSQRFYAVALYTAFFFWRLYDFYNLTIDESESLWLFMKWASIDGVFLYGLPNFRIPWLEWSVTTTTILFCLHALLDGVLMFRIPIPLGAGLVAVTRALYDREISISERRVKPADILNNPQLILGRQIIHILPEGSAILNPDKIPICLDSAKSSPSVILPLQINQTVPSSVELIRFDIDTGSNETITIASSQVRRLRRDAEKRKVHHRASEPLLLEYPVKKTGVYRLGRIIDETNLVVQHARSEIHVVSCPKAYIKSSGSDKCRGELSNVAIQVEGTPPLKIKYQRSVNGDERDVSYQSIQPDDFTSPLSPQKYFGPVVVHGSDDFSWAQTRTVPVPLNETLSGSGKWSYSIESVSDAFGNTVNYTITDDEDESPSRRLKAAHLEDTFVVHDRPQASLQARKGETMYRIAKGSSIDLPISLHARSDDEKLKHVVSYLFTPHDQIPSTGYQSTSATRHEFTMQSKRQGPSVKEPGLYTLQSVSSTFCEGEIIEPMSFRLINPPEPTLELQSEELHDKIGRPIGLRVSLDLSGTPPFKVDYSVRKKGQAAKFLHEELDSPRGIIEFRPESDGEYVYQFLELRDKIYKGLTLSQTLKQTVKPSVNAKFEEIYPRARACMDQTAQFNVRLQGEAPWTLEWEIVHAGRRKRFSQEDIKTSPFTIVTPPLTEGGEYSVALVSVKDNLGCTEALQHDAKVSVQHQRPTAAFGPIEAKHKVKILEGLPVSLPVRLSGEGPWSVTYRHVEGDTIVAERTKRFANANDHLDVRSTGTFELVDVRDSRCPGAVDNNYSRFAVEWIDRPAVTVVENGAVERVSDTVFRRQAVCEGAEDAVELQLMGRPPFHIRYEEHIKPESGSRSIRPARDVQAALHGAVVKMDTSIAGSYEYKLVQLGDYNYEHESRKHKPFTIIQEVHSRPSALFSNPGKIYSFCQGTDLTENDGTTTIPVTLTGQPPFQIDLEIRPYGKSVRATPLTIPNIPSKSHNLNIPNRLLTTGTSTLSIRRIRDARGCERILDSLKIDPAQRVQIAVHDRPTIIPAEPERQHYCVGDRIAFALSGVSPFDVYYSFEGSTRRAHVEGQTFRRFAETPGTFEITGLQDAASTCKTNVNLTKNIHQLPNVKVSKGKETRVDIHAGGQAAISFEFGGTPPFEFTYTRSENLDARGSGARPGAVLETKTLRSDDYELKIWASEEGTYEVVAIADAFCSFARPGSEGYLRGRKAILDI